MTPPFRSQDEVTCFLRHHSLPYPRKVIRQDLVFKKTTDLREAELRFFTVRQSLTLNPAEPTCVGESHPNCGFTRREQDHV